MFFLFLLLFPPLLSFSSPLLKFPFYRAGNFWIYPLCLHFFKNFPALPLSVLEDFPKSVCQITNLIIGHICLMSQPTHWNFQMQSYFSFSRMIPSPLTTPFHNVCLWIQQSLRSSWRYKLGWKYVFFSSPNYLCLFQSEAFSFPIWIFPFVMCVFFQRLKIPRMLFLIYK